MNGRLYDAKLHRFLQPDNYVQDPSNTQNFNRYGYVLNNPLKYTDFSGEKFTWSDLLGGLSIVAGTALVIFGGPAGVALGTKLIAAGVTHFGVATARYLNNGGSWADASNYAGFSSPEINFDPGWGDSKYKQNGVAYDEPVVKPKSDDIWGDVWNSDTRREITGDMIQFSVSWDALIFVGIGSNIEFNWLLTGDDASFFPYIGASAQVSGSDGLNVSPLNFGFGKAFHSGPVKSVHASSLPGWSYGGSVGGKIIVGADFGYNYSPDKTYGNYGWHQFDVSIGAGLELSPMTGANVKFYGEYNFFQLHTGTGRLYD